MSSGTFAICRAGRFFTFERDPTRARWSDRLIAIGRGVLRHHRRPRLGSTRLVVRAHEGNGRTLADAHRQPAQGPFSLHRDGRISGRPCRRGSITCSPTSWARSKRIGREHAGAGVKNGLPGRLGPCRWWWILRAISRLCGDRHAGRVGRMCYLVATLLDDSDRPEVRRKIGIEDVRLGQRGVAALAPTRAP